MSNVENKGHGILKNKFRHRKQFISLQWHIKSCGFDFCVVVGT